MKTVNDLQIERSFNSPYSFRRNLALSIAFAIYFWDPLPDLFLIAQGNAVIGMLLSFACELVFIKGNLKLFFPSETVSIFEYLEDNLKVGHGGRWTS